MKKIALIKSCQDLALCLNATESTLMAATANNSGEIFIEKFNFTDDLHQQLAEWRKQFGYQTDADTIYRFVPNSFMEQTRIAALNEETIWFNDNDLVKWLVTAEAGEFSGIDGKPVFETGFDKSSYDFTRLPNGQVALTELPRETLTLAQTKFLPAMIDIPISEAADLSNFPNPATPPALPSQAIETRIRAVARFLAEVSAEEYFNALKNDETVGIFAAAPGGVGFALWNPANGFFVELGEVFRINPDEFQVPGGMEASEFAGQVYAESVYHFLNDQFYRRIVPDDESIEPINLQKVFWTATDNLINPLRFLLNEFSRQTDFIFSEVAEPLETMIVAGLLLGADEQTTEKIPAVNLANDLALQGEIISHDESSALGIILHEKRRKALVCFLIPIACALGLVVGLVLNNWRIDSSLEGRRQAATIEKTRLQPFINARHEAEKTRDWFEDVLRQIIGLRKKQTSALGFAARLDPLIPTTDAFYISEMKLVPGGDFELKGLARKESEVAEFIKAMEFSADEKDARYFSGLSLEFKQGSPFTAQSSGVGNGVSGGLAPGVSGFLIKGIFAPASVIKAQENKPPAAVVPPATNANQGQPSANVNAPASNSNVNTASNSQTAKQAGGKKNE